MNSLQFPKRVTCPTCPACTQTSIRYTGEARECLTCGHKWENSVLRKAREPHPMRHLSIPMQHLERATRPFGD